MLLLDVVTKANVSARITLQGHRRSEMYIYAAPAGVTFPAIIERDVVVTHRSTLPLIISLTKSEMCFPLSGPTRSDDVMVPWTNTPFIGPVAPCSAPVRNKTMLLARFAPVGQYTRTTLSTWFILVAFTEYDIFLPPSVTVKVALPVATNEGFGGTADFPDKLVIKCACDCCAITDELRTPAEATNKVMDTVIIATTDTFVFIRAYTHHEYIGFTQYIDLEISVLQVLQVQFYYI
jgi:hypothetical protein